MPAWLRSLPSGPFLIDWSWLPWRTPDLWTEGRDPWMMPAGGRGDGLCVCHSGARHLRLFLPQDPSAWFVSPSFPAITLESLGPLQMHCTHHQGLDL